MRLFFLVALTMCAFAANSILTRVGVAHYGMRFRLPPCELRRGL